MAEKAELIRPNPEAYTIYQKYIKPQDSVIAIGPSHSIETDPTLLYIGSLIEPSNPIQVVDPLIISPANKNFTQIEEKLPNSTVGYGDLTSYLNQLNYLRSLGLNIAPIEWLGINSVAHDITLPDGEKVPDNSVTKIVDHATSVFITGGIENIDQRREALQDIYKEYFRVLNHKGMILLQTNSTNYELYGKPGINLKELLENIGFSVSHVFVRDAIKLQLSEEFYRKWYRSYHMLHDTEGLDTSESELIIAMDNIRKKYVRHDLTLFIENKGGHQSPDFYIATK